MANGDPDAAWLAQARGRVASGRGWERPSEEIEAAAKEMREGRAKAAPAPMSCPQCDLHPPLEVYRRYEVASVTPLRYCPLPTAFGGHYTRELQSPRG